MPSEMTHHQTTISGPVTFSGVGLHSGRQVTMRLCPAPADFGICFQRTDLSIDHPLIVANWDQVVPSQLCTKIANARGVSVSTIEHIMAAIAGCGLHNSLVEIDGPEVPILDGSAAQFVEAILAQGLQTLSATQHVLQIIDEVQVRNGDAWARLSPSDDFAIDFAIDFADPAIGAQSKNLILRQGAFIDELADSRTFCRRSDVDTMRKAGLALGGSFENAVVVDGADILTPGGLRHKDEAVRHKMLDALGDLALAGAPIMGRYSGMRAGHAMTNALLRALFARPGACRLIEASPEIARRMPRAEPQIINQAAPQ